MNKQNLPFWLFTIFIIIIQILPTLIQNGMFMDGLQYACVAKNLANGLGSFWHPYICSTWWKNGSNFFLEHPPLVFGIQSLFFKALGNGIYVERLYSLCTAVITAFLIFLIWKTIFENDSETKNLAWLSVLFWIIMPVCFWSYRNNLQENTMGIFTTLSVYFIIKALKKEIKSTFYIFIFLLLSGISIFLASFSKGVPGLFPIVTVFLIWLIYKNFSFHKMILYSAFLIFIPVVIYSLLLLNHDAYDSLIFYFKHRLLYRINEEPTVTSRFYIILRLLIELIPAIVIGVILQIYLKITKTSYAKLNSKYKKHILFFFLLGLSGSLPLSATLVQRTFYLVPSLPYFAIGLAILCLGMIKKLIGLIDFEKKSFKKFKIFSIMLVSGGILYSGVQFGKAGRDIDTLNDVYLIGSIVPKESTINIESSIYKEWSFQFYLIRHFNISLDPSNNKIQQYFIKRKESKTILSENYRKIKLMTKKYDLFKMP